MAKASKGSKASKASKSKATKKAPGLKRLTVRDLEQTNAACGDSNCQAKTICMVNN